jgi:hypothetical protein
MKSSGVRIVGEQPTKVAPFSRMRYATNQIMKSVLLKLKPE